MKKAQNYLYSTPVLIFRLDLSLTIKYFLCYFFAQRARFKAVESLKHPKKRVIVVCTDVAARGLDIPTVSTVVHYDVARAVDTFVHRSGRTAVSAKFHLWCISPITCVSMNHRQGRPYQLSD